MKVNSMRNLSILAGAILAAMGLFLWQETLRFPAGRSGEPGPALWPRILIVATVVIAIYLIVDMLRAREDRPVVATSLRLPVALMVASSLYLAIIELAGYFLATILYILASMWILRVRSWPMLAGVAIGFVVMVYAIFVVVLQIRFPMGLLAPLLEG